MKKYRRRTPATEDLPNPGPDSPLARAINARIAELKLKRWSARTFYAPAEDQRTEECVAVFYHAPNAQTKSHPTRPLVTIAFRLAYVIEADERRVRLLLSALAYTPGQNRPGRTASALKQLTDLTAAIEPVVWASYPAGEEDHDSE